MSDAEALSQQLLHAQLRTPTRTDVFDKEVDNLAASHDQLSAEVRNAHEAQNNAATGVQTLRTHLPDSAVARLINTTELLEMILLEVVDLSSDVAIDAEKKGCGIPSAEHCSEHGGECWYGDCCGQSCCTDFYGFHEGMFKKIEEKACSLRTVLLARRVSEGFRATIDNSSKLQQALFLRPDPPACASVRVNWLYLKSEVCHKLPWKDIDNPPYPVEETSDATRRSRHVTFGLPGWTLASWLGTHCFSLQEEVVADCECRHRSDCDVRASPNSSSWMGMYLSQPLLEICWARGTGSLHRMTRPTTISSFFQDV